MPLSPWFCTNMPGFDDKNWVWRGTLSGKSADQLNPACTFSITTLQVRSLEIDFTCTTRDRANNELKRLWQIALYRATQQPGI